MRPGTGYSPVWEVREGMAGRLQFNGRYELCFFPWILGTNDFTILIS